MKQSFTLCAVMLLLLLSASSITVFGQILSYTNASNGALSSVATNATGTSLLRVNGATAASSPCSNGFTSQNFSGSTTYSSSLSAVEVSATPNTGYSLNVTGFTADLNKYAGGPSNIRFAYSKDGGATWVAQSSDQSNRRGVCGKVYTLSWSTSISVNAPATLKFRVYAFNATKASGTEQIKNLKINGTVAASSTTSCGVPTLYATQNITSSSATLDWSDITGFTSYSVQYRVSGTTTWTTTTSSTSSKSLSGLAASTKYEYQVQTVCSGGTSAFTAIANFTTLAATTSCGVPTLNATTNITSSSATIDWSDVTGATSYNYQYRVSGTTTWTSKTATTSSANLSGLTAATKYEYQIQTVCSAGTSAFSAIASFTTSAATTCGVPSGLTTTNITTTSATLDWADVSGATSYNIQYRVSGTTTWTSKTSTASTLGLSGLTAATKYEYQVQTVCSAGTSVFSAIASFTTLTPTTTLPRPDHIVVLILENHAYSQIIGSSAAPHINALANDANSALFTQSFAIEHPSQPNYLDFYSGSNQGVTDDNVPTNIPFTTPNLGRQLIDATRSFTTYSEDLPSVGYNGATSGAYARKHNPAANWMGTGTNQIPATTNQPFTAFPTDYTKLPTVSYVVPNQNNDMHDGSITTGDNWMYNNLNNYIQWAKTNNSLFILTFDEDNGTEGNRVVTIFSGSMVAKGQYANTINHFNVLRTIENMYSLPYAGKASTSTSITNCWIATATASAPVVAAAKVTNSLVSVYPNPATSWVNFSLNQVPQSRLLIRIFDMTGRLIGKYELAANSKNLKVNVSAFTAGNYFYQVIQNNKQIQSGFFTR